MDELSGLQAFVRSHDLTVFVLVGSPLTAYPPHEHTVPATIAVLEGVETNVFHATTGEGDAVHPVRLQTVRAGEVLTLDPSVIHPVRYPTVAPTVGLHVHRGDRVGADRRLWSHRGDAPRPSDQAVYDALATAI